MLNWILSGWIHIVLGIILGWAWRPSFADKVVATIKGWLVALWTWIKGLFQRKP